LRRSIELMKCAHRPQVSPKRIDESGKLLFQKEESPLRNRSEYRIVRVLQAHMSGSRMQRPPELRSKLRADDGQFRLRNATRSPGFTRPRVMHPPTDRRDRQLGISKSQVLAHHRCLARELLFCEPKKRPARGNIIKIFTRPLASVDNQHVGRSRTPKHLMPKTPLHLSNHDRCQSGQRNLLQQGSFRCSMIHPTCGSETIRRDCIHLNVAWRPLATRILGERDHSALAACTRWPAVPPTHLPNPPPTRC